MARLTSFLLLLSLICFVPLCLCDKSYGGKLFPGYYAHSCPQVNEIVRSVVAKAVARETRMAASLLRLHFHDCFVQGCDGSLLLDSSGRVATEKNSNPNSKSARGFDVVDQIKAELEKQCPGTVSCADVLTLAARDSSVLTGGPSWVVPLGRRDSRSASLSQSNNNIPAPNNTFQTILSKFNRQGLDITDLVALSGSHTIGFSRCTSFRQRLYNQSGNGSPDMTLEQSFAANLRQRCPKSGGDQILSVLDIISAASFDNSYFKNLIENKGLLNSDQVLFSSNEKSRELVKKYAEDQGEFFEQFAESMIKMGNISPLTGSSGEIRKNCRKINS
ncbi:putative peroxidase [Arabidopsis thaliana]|jgi:peroxidase|uniref:Peroxidase 49 n=3 Tax=Arabidopsis TaxID=3701 RepID=PER49_ARATH|nr:Peroxidase superfamily protein [Arabidopsis thaliana]O23237.2 RecName: Full=Peroxidase 49; Short=Atperox P49; AltName: Full=ATP31; Flags: Precursor [Arabidopsis thaliana]KAG7618635.1 hem peroxidase [Arabidopsis thaliana x Arabidopsis arenosa]AAL40848.1 class III peroxidase ATP31 [Arabidopsis thaliana]AAL66993.1 putative peroxidase [Arabidopsis thaliana]AAM51313.1 putative peroxidase [Arabidopsis thaliana]AEE86655.1 Peroxidase superfamily protein [Arabidopsis thaliana]|eukprot:NP_195361.1 Peroxidase superfamily protein [Arabidopsis thaliana]